APCAFAPEALTNVLGEYLANHGKTQLRIAETEKYAHVTFFFSGGREEPFAGEERILIPSPPVATYDLKPEMSAPEVTDRLVEAIEQQRFDVIVANYANGDMVGHTGVFAAAVKAVECLDACLGRVVAALEKVGGEALITADHGNVEQMEDESTGQAHTAHTCEPVPFIYVGQRPLRIRGGGVLADVAPTMLKLLGLPQPKEMTGQPLVEPA
ncbi:2,3-bisphosphoglycerate-independent phosphoglycerate mutase, partial [Azotobacter chroococcum]